ncbi:T9SS type A sorting domain-containing protein [Paludibacteraceae bacterium OttesenSCG-928-F17]|nr:T9SS type A sorting domain-containing protein [Paludibacteraceae bacterium OttesenSCG-928-F17]
MKFNLNSLAICVLLSCFSIAAMANEPMQVTKLQPMKGEMKRSLNEVEAQSVPYFQDFEGNVDLTDIGWGRNTVNNEFASTRYSVGSSTSFISGNGNSEAFVFFPKKDLFAFSPAINLTAGKTYMVSVFVKTGWDTTTDPVQEVPENLTITHGTAATVAGIVDTIYDENFASSSQFSIVYAEFTPTTTGEYYFGITSQSNTKLFIIDDFYVREKATTAPETSFNLEFEESDKDALPWGSPVKFVNTSTNAPALTQVLLGEDATTGRNAAQDGYTIAYQFVNSESQLEVGPQTVRMVASNEIGEGAEAKKENAFTILAKGYDKFPYVAVYNRTSENPNLDEFKVKGLSRGWFGMPRTAQKNSLKLTTRPFQFKAGKYYTLTCAMTDGANGGGKMGVNVQRVLSNGGTANVTEGSTFDITGSISTVTQFTVSADAMYVVELTSYEIESAIFLLGLKIEENDAPQVNIESVEYPNLNVYTADKAIVIDGAEGALVSVYSVSGQLVESRIAENTSSFDVKGGLYIVKVGDKATKVIVK